VDELRGLMVAISRSAVRHRTTGHAAEMSFFAMLALVPATVTVGAAMHLVARAAGVQSEVREREAAVASIRWIIGPGLGQSIIVPFVRAQLTQAHGGVALGGLLITWWLFSHLFESTSHALDTAYGVEDHRRSPVRRAIALTYSLSAVSAITLTLAVMSAAPLGFSSGPGTSALPHMAQIIWTVARWPLLALVVLLTLTCLYRYRPDVRHSFRNCLPGALLGVGLWSGLVVGFRYYLALGFGAPTGVLSDDPRVTLIGQAVASVVGTSFLFYLASGAVLLGAELNAALIARRGRPVVITLPDESDLESLPVVAPVAAAAGSPDEQVPDQRPEDRAG
jgi:membrane protein